tara:strand:+ start:8232 stop:9074 length:843 start_codon:yes stop_codon:yes gene_type:complete
MAYKISVIIPSFNQGEWIEQTIQSVLAQDWPNVEIMVFDGGSSDNTVGILDKYKDKLSYYHSRPDRGQADAVNQGIAKSSGDIICWLNSDDLLCKDAFKSVSEQFSTPVDAVYGSWLWANSDLSKFTYDRAPNDISLNDFSAGHCLINQPALFTKRTTWDRVGLLNEDLHYALDYEWLVRFLQHGLTLKRIDRPLAINRIHSSMKSLDRRLRSEKVDVAKSLFGDEFSSASSLIKLYGLNILHKYPFWHLLGLVHKKLLRRSDSKPGIPIPLAFARKHVL